MNKIFKASFVVALIIIVSKVFGFGRELVVSYFYGASAITDSFYIANLIPNFFFLVVLQAISVAYIPVVLSIEKQETKEIAHSFSNKLIIGISVACILFSTLICIFSKQLINIFAPGFSDESILLASGMLKISCWFLLLQSPVSILAAFCQSKKKFIVPALFGLVTDAVYVALVIISFKISNAIILGFIPVISILLQFVIVLFVAKKNGFKVCLKGKVSKYVKQFVILSIPSLFSVGINQINTFVGKAIASNISSGAISSYNYAWNICNLYESLFLSSVCVVVFAELSDLLSQKECDFKRANVLYEKSFLIVSMLILPLCIFSSYFSDDLVRLIYERGSFDKSASELTSVCLLFLALGSCPYVLTNLGIRYLYARKKTFIPTLFAGLSFGVSILSNVFLFYFTSIGIAGIAISTSLANIFNFIILYLYLYKKEKIQIKEGFLKSVVFAFLSLISCIFVDRLGDILFLNISANLKTIITGILFLLIIGLAYAVLFNNFIKDFLKKFKKKKRI